MTFFDQLLLYLYLEIPKINKTGYYLERVHTPHIILTTGALDSPFVILRLENRFSVLVGPTSLGIFFQTTSSLVSCVVP